VATTLFGSAPWPVGDKRRDFDYIDVNVADIRGREAEFDLETHGFLYIAKQSAEKTFEDNEHIKQIYYPECADLMKRLYVAINYLLEWKLMDCRRTGATRVHVMGHVCRRQTWDAYKDATAEKDDMGRTPVPTTARYVHVGKHMSTLSYAHPYHFSRLLLQRCRNTPEILSPRRSRNVEQITMGNHEHMATNLTHSY